MKRLSTGFLFVLLSIPVTISAQNVAINTTGAVANSSAMLDVDATNKGLLIPRVALTATNSNAPIGGSVVTSLKVYNTATASAGATAVTPGYYYWDGAQWVRMLITNGAWQVGGNYFGGTATGYIFGPMTNDHIDWYTNGVVRGRMSNLGEFFIGATVTALAGDLMNGVANASFPWAVNGYTNQNGSGVYGSVTSGASPYSAIEGAYIGTGNGSGVYGNNQGSGPGAGAVGNYVGSATGTTTPTGVSAYSNPTVGGNTRIGVLGNYNGAIHYGLGIIGIGFGGGIITGNNDIAVVGWRANNSNFSGYFNGNHAIANGTKSASVGTQWGNQLLYCMESPEVWFEDIGRGTLNGGSATIYLDSIFKQVTVIDQDHPIHVFVQLEGECEDVFVTPGTSSFTVTEKNNGHSNVSFSYRVIAKRVHFQDHRYGNDPLWGEGDTRPYMQYATPPPVDYKENVKFQEFQKQNWKPTTMPQGFIDYFQLQKQAQEQSNQGTRDILNVGNKK
jgi:hypothetical protein